MLIEQIKLMFVTKTRKEKKIMSNTQNVFVSQALEDNKIVSKTHMRH
jgi:hypothetical protein